jgi:hypothetical protein
MYCIRLYTNVFIGGHAEALTRSFGTCNYWSEFCWHLAGRFPELVSTYFVANRILLSGSGTQNLSQSFSNSS